MLYLTRNVGQTIFIGKDIKVTIRWSKGKQVGIGVECPKEIEVHREEYLEKKAKEKEKKSNE